jgi:hypothetical protein
MCRRKELVSLLVEDIGAAYDGSGSIPVRHSLPNGLVRLAALWFTGRAGHVR